MTAFTIAAVVAVLGWLCAAGLAGLWLGERGRRMSAEAFLGMRPPPVSRKRPRSSDAPVVPAGPPQGEARVLDGGGVMNPKKAAERVKRLYGIEDDRLAEEIARTVIGGTET